MALSPEFLPRLRPALADKMSARTHLQKRPWKKNSDVKMSAQIPFALKTKFSRLSSQGFGQFGSAHRRGERDASSMMIETSEKRKKASGHALT